MNSLALKQCELMDNDMLATTIEIVFLLLLQLGLFAMVRGPIGWEVRAAYLATCAASGAFIGYGSSSLISVFVKASYILRWLS